MNVKIWRVLAQILFYRNDLIEITKPFFENLKNENMNDEIYFPLLKTLNGIYSKFKASSKYHQISLHAFIISSPR